MFDHRIYVAKKNLSDEMDNHKNAIRKEQNNFCMENIHEVEKL